MKFTIDDLKKSKVYDLNKHLFEVKVKRQRKPSKQVEWVRNQLTIWCKEKGYELLEEHRFFEFRKWKFDFAIKEIMTAIEYEGLNSEKSGHTTIMGYTNNTEKYNQAQSMGWRVLRFTVINYKSVIQELEKSEDGK